MTTEDPDGARYATALGALSQVLVHDASLRTTLAQLLAVAELAAPELTALTVTAITDDGELTSAASTDDSARSVDEFEYAVEEGPCVATLQTGEEQLVRDVGSDGRWPRFATRAAEEGFGSIAGLPLRAGDGTVIGALDVFSDRVDGISERDLAVLRRVCAPAGAVLANARAYRRTSRLGDQLVQELESRAVINRAVGVVLGHRGGDADTALATLERAAERDGVPLSTVAERVLASGQPPDRDDRG